jgi:hypothetical protein
MGLGLFTRMCNGEQNKDMIQPNMMGMLSKQFMGTGI